MVARRHEADLEGLVVALSPELTGRVHLAYRRRTDRRWWRRRYPRGPVPEWELCSLCGRHGLIPGEPWRAVDCRACERAISGRRHRMARQAG